MALTATFVDADTFTIVGDKTTDFVANRRVKCDCGVDGDKYGVVLSSSYSSPNTTVNLTAASDDLTSNLVTVSWSVVLEGATGNLPLHDHSDEDGGGTVAHSDTTGQGTDDHHAKYTGAEAVTAAKTVKLDDFTAPDDNTDLNASITAHGLCPKGDNEIGHYLRGDLTWGAPSTGLQNIREVINYGGSDFIQHWVYIPQFTVLEVSGVTFGGFYVGKYESSQPNATSSDDNPDVADNTDPGTCPAISQQGVAPWRYVSYVQARKAAANLGAGCHLITAFEWASLAYWA